jgi:excisionase family DNA binding protein
MSENPQIAAIVSKYVNGLPPYVSVRQAAQIRDCCVDHIYRLIGRGRIRAVKDGKLTKVETVSLLEDQASLPPAKIAMNARDRQRQADGRTATP